MQPLRSMAFISALQTGNGSEQSIPHGLGDTPGLVIIVLTPTNDSKVYTEGTHDATNIKVTVTNLATYKIVAFPKDPNTGR